MHIGKAVKSIMAQDGISQAFVADKLGCERSQVSRKLAKQDWRWSDMELYADVIGTTANKIVERAQEK